MEVEDGVLCNGGQDVGPDPHGMRKNWRGRLMAARWVATWRCSLAFNRTLLSPFASGLIKIILLVVFSCHF
jgi:hypothetical protein